MRHQEAQLTNTQRPHIDSPLISCSALLVTAYAHAATAYVC